MKVTIDTDDMSVNEKGETLRGLVFNQVRVKTSYGVYRKTGCYSTFEVNKGFVEIDPQKYPALYDPFKPDGEIDPTIKVTAYESDKIVAMWWWDGDGSLLLWIKGEPIAYVSWDCKHADEWREQDVP